MAKVALQKSILPTHKEIHLICTRFIWIAYFKTAPTYDHGAVWLSHKKDSIHFYFVLFIIWMHMWMYKQSDDSTEKCITLFRMHYIVSNANEKHPFVIRQLNSTTGIHLMAFNTWTKNKIRNATLETRDRIAQIHFCVRSIVVQYSNVAEKRTENEKKTTHFEFIKNAGCTQGSGLIHIN